MERLGRVIVEAIALEYGRREVLRRLSHPFWFQSFGAVMGMDWHSSGITTSVLGALKRGLRPVEDDLGIHVCGGRGKASRLTPGELVAIGERTGLDGDALARTSRMVAKVDSAAVQDGFELYLHGFIVDDDGGWVVVQQGMRPEIKKARRYHWSSEQVRSFVEAPHTAIEGEPGRPILNLTDRAAAAARAAQVELVREGPEAVIRELRRMRPEPVNPQLALPHLDLPDHHDVRPEDVVERRLGAAILAARERGPIDFAGVLETPGVGARTVRALALVAEVLHGAPARFSDPARFSFAHGGKDGHPFPVPLRVYDRTLSVLRDAVTRAKLGEDDRFAALRRLDAEARALEHRVVGVDVEGLIEAERAASPSLGGRSVGGPVR